jgi:flagella basal body P-ring formation protein FlgA
MILSPRLSAFSAALWLIPTAHAGERAPGSVTVTLSLEARVRGTEVELGEIARVAGLDPELVESVRSLELGYAPAPGYSRLVSLDRVRDALRRALPQVDVLLEGERACRVWPEVEEIRPESIEETARVALLREFAEREAVFTLARPLARVLVPAGSSAAELVARAPDRELASGLVDVAVEVQVEGSRYRTVWTSWRVELWETRPVLARAVRAGEELSPELFQRSRVKAAGDSRPAPLDPRAVLGSVAKRDLAPGEPVTSLDVHRPAAVTLGSQLYLRVQRGAIEARVSVLALDSGAVGDRVRVKTFDSGKELTAFVTGRDQCEIVLDR